MSVSDISIDSLQHMDVFPGVSSQRPKLHRIRTVRRQQGVSMRRAVQTLRTDVRQLREEEEETTDLPISRLYAWQKLLEVPLIELLAESGSPLSTPVLERARMIRVMKTVAAILEQVEQPSVRRLTQNLVEQLREIMPELEGVGPWHSVGQRRSLREYGRIIERAFSDDVWRDRE